MEEIKRILEDHEKRISKIEELIFKKKIEIITDRLKNFSKAVNFSEEELKKIYDFDFSQNKLTVIKTIGKDDKEKTQNITLLALLGYKYCYDKTYVLAKELRRIVAENGISLSNFASYLNEIIPSLIRRKGKPRSPKTSYKLTIPGEVKAKDLIKKLLIEQ